MLILQRRIGQSIKIGDSIEVVVLEVSGEHVRLGIEAPREIRVLRHELLEALSAENRAASAPPTQAALDPVLGSLRGFGGRASAASLGRGSGAQPPLGRAKPGKIG